MHKGREPVVTAKGAAAEGKVSHPLPGHTNKIRVTVAYNAERYVFIWIFADFS